MIDSLLYLTVTRPDIHFAIYLRARFQASSPRTCHYQAVKRILKYLKHTLEYGLWFSASSSLSLQDFSDAYFVGYRIDIKSISGTYHFLGNSLVY